MATSTAHLGLSLLSTGESVGTWGIPLNNNFSKIDVLSGEVISARGSEADVDSRFSTLESEITSARGIEASLSDRLGTVLQLDGTIIVEAIPASSSTQIGVTRLSINPVAPLSPIAVGDNDPRLFTLIEKDALTNGGVTGIHLHNLMHIADVTATSADVNQALDGIGATVTAANLTSLTDGSIASTGLHTHVPGGFATLGLVRISVTPVDLAIPISVGDNDPRMLTQIQHDQLTSGGTTSSHTHTLASGATDLTVTATALNQLAGMGAAVTASNLNLLTGGTSTTLHDHDGRYYTKTEADVNQVSGNTYSDVAIATHNGDDTSHMGSNLILGQLTAEGLETDAIGESVVIRADPADAANIRKLQVKDSTGIPKMFVDTEGNLTCENLTVNGASPSAGEVIAARAGHADLDTRLDAQDSSLAATSSEILAARNGEASLSAKLTLMETTQSTFVSLNNNPHTVTITQAISADGGTDISVAELETLSDGSNADSLHSHAAVDTILLSAINSSIYGAFPDIDGRLEGSESVLNGHTTELTNARNGEASLDARLDALDLLLSSVPGKYTTAFTATATIAVTHGLNTSQPVVAVYDSAGVLLTGADVTSVTVDSVNTLTIVLAASDTGTLVVMG